MDSEWTTDLTPEELADIRAEIIAVNKETSELIQNLDFENLMPLYAEDCRFMPPDGPVRHGRKEIEEWLRKTIPRTHEFSFRTDEVGGTRDHPYERGMYRLCVEKDVLYMEGRCLVIFKRVNGKLLVDVDIWN
eukprot:UN26816